MAGLQAAARRAACSRQVLKGEVDRLERDNTMLRRNQQVGVGATCVLVTDATAAQLS
jgi:hypothetical protein